MDTRTSTPRTVPGALSLEASDDVLDLAEDCREVSGVLAPYVGPLRLPQARSAPYVDITPLAVAGLDGYDEYGS